MISYLLGHSLVFLLDVVLVHLLLRIYLQHLVHVLKDLLRMLALQKGMIFSINKPAQHIYYVPLYNCFTIISGSPI